MAPQTRSQTRKVQASSWDRFPLEVRQRIATHLVNIAASGISNASKRTFHAIPLVSYSFGHDDCYRALQRLEKGLGEEFARFDDYMLIGVMDVELSDPEDQHEQHARDVATWNYLQAWRKKAQMIIGELDEQAARRNGS